MKKTPAGLAAIALAIGLSACGSPQDKEQRHLQKGKAYFDQGDYASAVAEFKNASQSMPSDAEPYYQQALVHMAASNFRLAVEQLRHAIELNPKHGQAQLRLAELMTTSTVSRDVKDAKSKIQELLASKPDDMEAIAALAAADWKLGLQGAAEDHLKQALDKFPRNVRASALLAKVRILNRDLPGAEQVVRKAAETSPQSVAVLLAAGEFYSLLGRAADAEGYFRRVLQVDPNHVNALMSLGALQKTTGNQAAAEQTYQRLSNLSDTRYRATYAIFLLDSGRAGEAIPRLEELRAKNLDDRGLRSLLVNAYVAAGRYADADRMVTQALETNPKDIAAYFERSLTRFRNGRLTEAQADASQVLAMQPNSAQVHFLQAMIHRRTGAVQAQQNELTETLRLNPNLLSARLELARLLVHLDAAGPAITLLDDALPLQKKSPALIAQRNWALFVAGDIKQLERGIQEGLSASRTTDLLVQDALLNLQRGRTEAAQKSIDETLRIDPAELRALNMWIRILSRNGNADTALRGYAQQHAVVAAVQQFYGEWLLSSNHREEARAAFLRAKAAQPAFTPADFALAQMAIQDGNPAEARRLLGTLLTGLSATRAHLMMAAVEQMQRNIPEAIRHLETVVAAEPANVPGLNDLAYLLVESGGNAETALRYAQKAQELSPRDPNVADTLGWVFYHRGMYSLASQYLKDSLSRKDAALTNLHLAMTCAKMGELKRGRDYLAAAQRQSPNLPGIGAARQLLERTN